MNPVVAIIGPSGSGKSSVVRELHRRRLITVHPTWTTRPRRPDEPGGSLEHRFVDDDEFDRLDAAGFFCETVRMFGLPYRYGLSAHGRSTPGRVDVVMVRAALVDRLRTHLPVGRVYQIEDESYRSWRRMIDRGATAVDVAARVADNERESALGRHVADRTFRNDRSIADLADRLAEALRHDAAHLVGPRAEAIAP